MQRLREELFRQDDDAVLKPLLTAIDRALGQKRDDICNDYKAKFATQDARIRELEQKLALAQQFADLARDLDARQIARDECQARIRNDPAN